MASLIQVRVANLLIRQSYHASVVFYFTNENVNYQAMQEL